MSSEFGQIELLLIKENKRVYFLATRHSSSYSPEFGQCEVQSAIEGMMCLNAELCLHHYPELVISRKHSIADAE